MRKKPKTRRLHRAAVLLTAGLLLTLGASCAESNALDPDIYAASLADADVWIKMPALRQYGGYTCGTTCVQMIMNWIRPYEADLNLAQYEELLGTTPENGTSPDAILQYFHENGVQYTASQRNSIADLQNKLDAGHPVLIPIQAWSSAEDGSYNTDDPSDSETYLAEGHWVICVGYHQDADRSYFIFNDPACVGNNIICADDLDRRWIDMDAEGNIYDHFGIEITQIAKYDPNGLFYMD